jgi:hypothetical protein
MKLERVGRVNDAPNPHPYAHINYVVNGVKGMVRILAVEQEGVIYRDGLNWR